MKTRSINLIFFLILISFKGISQGVLYDDQQMFKLIVSGKSKVKVFNKGLVSIWQIDSIARVVTVNSLEPTLMNPTAPKFDNSLSIFYYKKYFFNVNGNIDSILTARYHIAIAPVTDEVDTVADTTMYIYSYPLLENWPMNVKEYSIRKGVRKLLRTDHFGYDSQQRLILHIQDEGRLQFYYSYNNKGQIEAETIRGSKILYEYNSTGQVITRISDTQKAKYEYDKNQFLIREIVTGNNAHVYTYEYE